MNAVGHARGGPLAAPPGHVRHPGRLRHDPEVTFLVPTTDGNRAAVRVSALRAGGGARGGVRLEHVTLLTDAQMRKMKGAKMTFGVSTQIIFSFAEQDSYSANFNDNQYRNAYRLKSYYDGIDRLALSSDTPATTWADPDNVFTSIKAAVTRRAYNGADIVREQAPTVPQAVLLRTARGATVPLYEGRLGQIAPGFEASFIVLDRDIFSTPAEDVDTISVSET